MTDAPATPPEGDAPEAPDQDDARDQLARDIEDDPSTASPPETDPDADDIGRVRGG